MTKDEQFAEMQKSLEEGLHLHRQLRFGTHPELELWMRRVHAVLLDIQGVPFALTALVPNHVTLGEPSFTLVARGTGFTPDSAIVFNGSAEPTTYVSDTELSTGVNMETAEAAVTVQVWVQHGAGVTEGLPFTFQPAARRATEEKAHAENDRRRPR